MVGEAPSAKCDLVKSHCTASCQGAAGKGRKPSCSGVSISSAEWLEVERLWTCDDPICDFEEPTFFS